MKFIIMRASVFLIFFAYNAFPTAQIPDLIIIDNDTLTMNISPMKAFFPFYREMPWKYRKLSSNTNCYRGYLALWEMKNDSLYLRQIYSCNPITYYRIKDSSSIPYFKKIGLPKRALDSLKKMNGNEFSEERLKSFLGVKGFKKYRWDMMSELDERYEKRTFNKKDIVANKFVKNNYFACEFSGKISIPIGELIYYNIAEKYLNLTFLNGVLLEKYSTKTTPTPFEEICSDCENKGIHCAALEYFLNKKQITREKAEYYFKIGCDSNDINSCKDLGQLYLSAIEKEKAWEPLAKSCFVNQNCSCNEMRDNKMLLPPYMSPKKEWGPNWPEHFIDLDRSIIQNQNIFKECYEKRALDDGFLRVQIEIRKGKVNDIKVIENKLNDDFTQCFIAKLKSIEFNRQADTTIDRSFNYSSIYTTGKFPVNNK